MGVYEDYYVGDCFGEGEGFLEEGPGVWVCVEDDDEEGGWRPYRLVDQLSGSAERDVQVRYLQLRAHNDRSHRQRS